MELLNVSTDTNFNVTITPIKALTSSTPFKRPAGRAGKGKKKTYVREVCDTCTFCGKEYRCHRSFLKHNREHVIRDASSRYPDVGKILEHCRSSFIANLDELKGKPAFSSLGQKYLLFLDNLKLLNMTPNLEKFLCEVHNAIVHGVGETKVTLPSALLNTLIINCEILLSDVTSRTALCNLLQECVESDIAVLNCFVADYTLLLVDSIVKFYSSCVVAQDQGNVVSSVQISDEGKEVIHYISGSVLRGFYKKSLSFPKHIGWSRIGKVIVTRLLENDNVPGAPATVKGWTNAMSRGKLFLVSGTLFDFFVGVAEILEATHKDKVKIDYGIVLESVCQGVVLLLWDEAVGDFLNETSSYEFMCGMIRSFCNTYGVGHTKKILNNLRKNKAEASIPLRHKVAPKI